MSCRHYHHEVRFFKPFSGNPIPIRQHRCTVLESSFDARVKVQDALVPKGLAGSQFPTECPIATFSSAEWSLCPYYMNP